MFRVLERRSSVSEHTASDSVVTHARVVPPTCITRLNTTGVVSRSAVHCQQPAVAAAPAAAAPAVNGCD